MKNEYAIVALSLSALCGQSLADMFDDESLFFEQVNVEYTNTFNGLDTGAVSSLDFSSGDYSYTVSAAGPGGGMLSVRDGEISTTHGMDGILITFTGADVYAVGGHLWSTLEDGETVGGYISLVLDDGTFEIFSATSRENFRGLSSESAIESIFIDLPDGDELFWASMDSLSIGTLVPAPSALGLLGVAGIGAARRRR
tara:strand:- start:47383 stop:47976 length:594 start_codon:yes stop_codon:yes gene_type:complete